MKKPLSILTVLLLLFSCGNNENETRVETQAITEKQKRLVEIIYETSSEVKAEWVNTEELVMTFPQDSFKLATDPGNDDEMIRAQKIADGMATKGFTLTGKKICVKIQYPDGQQIAYECSE